MLSLLNAALQSISDLNARAATAASTVLLGRYSPIRFHYANLEVQNALSTLKDQKLIRATAGLDGYYEPYSAEIADWLSGLRISGRQSLLENPVAQFQAA